MKNSSSNSNRKQDCISPIDGRYGSKTANFRSIFSEYGLIFYRVKVEVRWLQKLAAHPSISEVPEFSAATNQQLDDIVTNFSEAHAQRIKDRKIDKITGKTT